MMLVGGGMRVALASIHLALSAVPGAITPDSLESTIKILHADLVQKFGILQPHIFVAGLNPHAGEDGYLGTEEIEVINPVLQKLRQQGMQLSGALPADTMFSKNNLQQADCFLAMYHDQGPARAQICQLRQRGECDSGFAHHPHLGGSWHCSGPGR